MGIDRLNPFMQQMQNSSRINAAQNSQQAGNVQSPKSGEKGLMAFGAQGLEGGSNQLQGINNTQGIHGINGVNSSQAVGKAEGSQNAPHLNNNLFNSNHGVGLAPQDNITNQYAGMYNGKENYLKQIGIA